MRLACGEPAGAPVGCTCCGCRRFCCCCCWWVSLCWLAPALGPQCCCCKPADCWQPFSRPPTIGGGGGCSRESVLCVGVHWKEEGAQLREEGAQLRWTSLIAPWGAVRMTAILMSSGGHWELFGCRHYCCPQDALGSCSEAGYTDVF